MLSTIAILITLVTLLAIAYLGLGGAAPVILCALLYAVRSQQQARAARRDDADAAQGGKDEDEEEGEWKGPLHHGVPLSLPSVPVTGR